MSNDKPRHLTLIATVSTRCKQHPSFEADYCPSCGTARVIGGK